MHRIVGWSNEQRSGWGRHGHPTRHAPRPPPNFDSLTDVYGGAACKHHAWCKGREGLPGLPRAVQGRPREEGGGEAPWESSGHRGEASGHPQPWHSKAIHGHPRPHQALQGGGPRSSKVRGVLCVLCHVACSASRPLSHPLPPPFHPFVLHGLHQALEPGGWQGGPLCLGACQGVVLSSPKHPTPLHTTFQAPGGAWGMVSAVWLARVWWVGMLPWVVQSA